MWDAVFNFIIFLQSPQARKPCMVQRGDTKKKFLGSPLQHRQSYPASGVPAFRELGHKYAYSQI
jgi:hypothetical protein